DLAIAAGVPILPVAIAGTRACRPKGSRWFGQAHAIAKVLPPLSVEGLRASDSAALAERARVVLSRELPLLRARACVEPAPPLAMPFVASRMSDTASAPN